MNDEKCPYCGAPLTKAHLYGEEACVQARHRMSEGIHVDEDAPELAEEPA